MYVFGSGGVGGVGFEWVTRLVVGFTNSGGAWGNWQIHSNTLRIVSPNNSQTLSNTQHTKHTH